ncbi:hypothetical protein N1028_13805 [Herbiconiux sp. CPCC 203407]|uniref:Sec-independent protein translocase protein TatB n=1 Tax=Herbiconiux oxytropis TaxID=2970915 RepID=A0AA41XK09_9MICO|nr:hypothetical protein [Herbiconiux oxytropis]MCS5724096.1 hypothetical protein [Herbiconiux oxytropis]MCS5726971.1 hypothetical protein [Herbiconiux oxytropis]
MLFDVSLGEAFVLIAILLGVAGPRRVAGLLREVKSRIRSARQLLQGTSQTVTEAWAEHRSQLGLDDIKNLDPRSALREALEEDEPELPSTFVAQPPPMPEAAEQPAHQPAGH